MEENPDTKVIHIMVFSTKGCGNTLPAKKILEETAMEMGVNIEMKTMIISTQEEADKYGFHGSPTILVNGLDLDPEMRDNQTYGFA